MVSHSNPDGDAVGSVLALYLALRKLGKEVAAATADPAPALLNFLPALNQVENSIAGAHDLIISLPMQGREDAEITTKLENGKLKIIVRPAKGKPFDAQEASYEVGKADYDLIISCDTPDLALLGKLFEANPALFYETALVNIDHHPSNTGYGKVNLVDTTAASASELVLQVIRELETSAGKPILDPDIATLILTGIITDTGSFQNSNTTPRSFEIAADLIEAGARQQEIIKHVYKTKPLNTLKLWGKVLSRIEYDPLYRIVWSTITADDIAETQADPKEASGIIDELMSNAPGAEIVLLLRQTEAGVSASLRTTTPAVSATDLAAQFNGGGHLRAAGFRIDGKQVSEVVGDVLTKFRDHQAGRLGIVSNRTEETKPLIKPTKAETVVRKTLSLGDEIKVRKKP